VKTWGLGPRQVVQHPLVEVGYGSDTFLKVYAAEVDAEKDKGAVEKMLPGLHRTFAVVLMENGVQALILFGWIFIRVVSTLTNQWRQSTVAETKW
jgi:hypothetical protein